MKKNTITIVFSLVLFFTVLAGQASAGVPSSINSYTSQLSSKIGSTLFEFYKFNYHDQLTVIKNLKYCGADDMAEKVISSVPDLPSFSLQPSSHMLFVDLINKEAIRNGYTLNNEEIFKLISQQSLVKGQAYFADYLKGHQSAMQRSPDNTATEPFCQAALDEADKFIPNN